MTERISLQTRQSGFSDRKVVKITQVNSDYYKIKMFCFKYQQWERRCRVILCERRRRRQVLASDKKLANINVGDLFVQVANNCHDALEEAQEDGGESEGSDATVW